MPKSARPVQTTRCVIDTNVIVSGAINGKGPPGKLLDAIADSVLVPVISRPILEEYARVLARPRFGFSGDLIEDILQPLEALAIPVVPEPVNEALPDPDDAIFIAAARHIDCPLVTGNIRHFPPETGIRLLTPREALTLIKHAT